MNIEFSDESTKHIESAIGTNDPAIVKQVFDRIAADEQLIQAFVLPQRTDDDLRESLAQCDRGVQEIAEGKTQPAKAALRAIAGKHGLSIDR